MSLGLDPKREAKGPNRRSLKNTKKGYLMALNAPCLVCFNGYLLFLLIAVTSTTIFPLPMANVKYGDVDCQRDYLVAIFYCITYFIILYIY